MKKKFIAVYALIGVLALGSTALTSCVDDNESASVTAVRDAKAAQLNALAAEANANAKVNEALAALKQAKAEAQTIENEFDQQEYAARLEKLQAEYAQYTAEAQQQMLKDLADHQISLYNSYNAVQGQVTTVSEELAAKYVEVAKLESGLTSAEAAANALLVNLRMDSIALAAEKEAYVAMGTNDYEALLKEYNTELVNEANQTKEAEAKANAVGQALTDFNNAKYLIEGKEDATVTISSRAGEEGEGESTGEEEGEGESTGEEKNDKTYTIAPAAGTAAHADSLSTMKIGDASQPITVMNEEYLLPDGTTAEEPTDDEPYFTKYSLNEAGVNEARRTLENEVETAEEELGTDKDKALYFAYKKGGDPKLKIGTWDAKTDDTNSNKEADYDEITKVDKISEEATAWAILNTLEEALKAAQENQEDVEADKDATDSQKEAAEEQVYTINQILTKFKNGDTDSKFMGGATFTEKEKALADANENLAAFERHVASLTAGSNDYKAYEASIKALMDKEGAAYLAAKEALNTAYQTLAQTKGKVEALRNMVGNITWTDANDNGKVDDGETTGTEGTTPNIQQLIADCEKEIAEKNEEIKNAALIIITKEDEDNNSTEYLYEALIENANAEIEEMEAKLAMLQESAAYWREQLEASIQNGTATTPDTPATDTPAEGEETPAA